MKEINSRIGMFFMGTIFTFFFTSSSMALDVGGTGAWHGFGHARNTTRLIADLTGASGSGEVVYLFNSKAEGLKAGITLPVDGKTLADSNAAASAKLILQFTNASCSLEVTNMYFQYPKNSAPGTVNETVDYQVGVRSNSTNAGNTVTAIMGSCQNAGSTNNNDVPTIKSGDTVSVLLNGVSTPILTGTFK